MNVCEEGAFASCGRLGVSLFHRWRVVVIGVTSFLTFLNFALVAVAYVGSSYNTDAVKGAAWTVEINPNGNDDANDDGQDSVVGYFGLREVYYPQFDSVIEYNSCTSSSSCNDCYHAGKKAMTATGFAITFAIILFILNCLRICVDRVIFKVTLLVFGFMNFICLASAMGIWNNECVHNIVLIDSDYVLSAGPGMASVAVSFVFNFISFWVNLLTPTKDTTPPPDLNNQFVAPVGVVHNVAAPTVATSAPVYGQPQPYGQPVYAVTGTPAPYTAYGNKV